MPWKKVGKTGDVSSLNELVSRFLTFSKNFNVHKNQPTVECFCFVSQGLFGRMNLSCLF